MDGRVRIAGLLGEVVTEARGLLDRGPASTEERSNVLMFYVLAEHLCAAATSLEWGLGPAALAGGLQQRRARCQGALAGFRPRVEQALHEAEMLDWEYRTA